MTNYKTPDVYVEEISTLPPSVAGVSTAVPAFIGYTTKARKEGSNVTKKPVRITTYLEFQSYFGTPQNAQFSIQIADNQIDQITTIKPVHNLAYQVDMYFKNGGGACYIVSLGDANAIAAPSKTDFSEGLTALEKEDEPTLLILSEASKLASIDYYDICKSALRQANDLKDRFVVMDVLDTDTTGVEFRSGIGQEYLKYGAAYAPNLITSLSYKYSESEVSVSGVGSQLIGSISTNTNGITVTYSGIEADVPRLRILGSGDELTFTVESVDGSTRLTISGIGSGKTPQEIFTAWNIFTGEKGAFGIALAGTGSESVTDTISAPGTQLTFSQSSNVSLESIQSTKTVLYNKIKVALEAIRIELPSSGAVTGAIASTDRDRGVWKSPANVSLSYVIGPKRKINNEEQENLNIDANAGKSINAIRSFTGKGTLIWGARTLAGNDNEWRYISVRRLFNFIEESVKKATYFAVFESNDAATWLKVKAVIESFLYGLWQRGALAGPTPESAYYVNIGLGKSMTTQDILEGRMIVEIGIAAVRPAEFIILRFSHKLQEA